MPLPPSFPPPVASPVSATRLEAILAALRLGSNPPDARSDLAGESLGSVGGGVGDDDSIQGSSRLPSDLGPLLFEAERFQSGRDVSNDLFSLLQVGPRPADEVCCGWIGTGRARFCCVPTGECTIAAHANKKASLAPSTAYMMCGVTKAYYSPSLEVAGLPGDVIDMLEGQRTHSAWSSLFAECQRGSGLTEPEIQEVRRRADTRVTFAPATPGRAQATDDGISLFSPDQDSDENIMQLFASWNPLVAQTRRAVSTVNEPTLAMINAVDTKISSLKGELGQHPPHGDAVPAATVWDSVAVVHDHSKMVAECLADTVIALAEEKEKTAALGGEVASLRSTLSNVESTVAGLVTTVANHERENVVRNEIIEHLVAERDETQIFREAFAGLRKQVAEVVRSRPTDDWTISGATPGEILARLEQLETETGRLTAGAGYEIVVIDGKSYHSPEELEPWIQENMPDGSVHMWLDAISMMECVQDATRGTTAKMKLEAEARKSGQGNLNEGRIALSFGVTLPQFFSKVDSSVFDAAETFSKWDAGHMKGTSLADRGDTAVRQFGQAQMSRINLSSGSKAAKTLGKELITDCQAFWIDFKTWVTQFYRFLTTRDTEVATNDKERKFWADAKADTDIEAWELTRLLVEDIFREIGDRRASGVGAQSDSDGIKRSAAMLHATLCAHKMMKDMIAREFERHPALAPRFNTWLFQARASRSDLKRVHALIEDMSASYRDLQRRLDKGNAGPAKKKAKPNGNNNNNNNNNNNTGSDE